MPDTPEKELEKLTNETLGAEFGGLQSRTETPKPEQEPAPIQEPPQGTPTGGEPTLTQDEIALLSEIRNTKTIGDLPHKSVKDLIDGYKELQGRFSKDRERFKPYEYILDELERNPNYQNWIRQADTLFRNPELAKSFVTPQSQVVQPPDPARYDRYSPEGEGQYQKDLMAYMESIADRKANERVSGVTQQLELERQKAQLSRAFPDANVDDLIRQIQARGSNWTLVDTVKALRYDNIKTQALDEARKELTKKLEEASKSGTPQGTQGAPKVPNLDEILDFIQRQGSEAAKKKYGDRKYYDAVRESTNLLG